MKKLTEYISEGLRINKNTKVLPSIDVLCEYTDTNFSKEDFDQIIDGAKKLPIIPNYIYNGLKGKDTKVKTFLNLVYEPNPNNNEKYYHGCNVIRIKIWGDGFIVRFIRMDYNETDWCPEDDKESYHSIKEVFKCIEEVWESLKFEKSIEKYR